MRKWLQPHGGRREDRDGSEMALKAEAEEEEEERKDRRKTDRVIDRQTGEDRNGGETMRDFSKKWDVKRPGKLIGGVDVRVSKRKTQARKIRGG